MYVYVALVCHIIMETKFMYMFQVVVSTTRIMYACTIRECTQNSFLYYFIFLYNTINQTVAALDDGSECYTSIIVFVACLIRLCIYVVSQILMHKIDSKSK